MSETNNKLFSYTTNLLMRFFEKRSVSSGDRLFALFQREEEVKGQYDALKKAEHFAVNDWEWPDGDYQSFCIDINGTNLIVAAAVDGVHEDFLTGLRNKIDSDAFQFKEHAILFLLHKPLDSLISGSDNLSKGGMPLHLDEISKSIAKDIEVNQSLKWHESAILNYTLKRKANNLFIKNRSLFDLDIFLNILGAGQITPDSYEKLGMFPDPEFRTVSKSAKNIIKERLDQNTDWFDKIQSGHQYGHVTSYLEKTFSAKGVEALKEPITWMTNKYEDLVKWAKEKSEQKGVEYLEEFINQTNEGLNFWDRGDGDSAAKSRRRNICIFNPEKKEACAFDLKFDGTIFKRGLRDGRKAKLSCSGKKLTVSIEIETPEEVNYYNFRYDDPNSNHKFNFSVIILPFEEGLLSGIKTCYLVHSSGSKKAIEITPDDDVIILNDVGRGKKEFPLGIDETYELGDDCQLKLNTDEIEVPEGETYVNFFLSYDNTLVPMLYSFDTVKPVFINGTEVWIQKRQDHLSFNVSIYSDSKKREVVSLEHGNKKFYVQGEFRDNIKREALIIRAGGLCWQELEPEKIIEDDEISIPDNIKNAYLEIIEYYQGNNKLLPSTAFLNDDLTRLYSSFTDALVSFLQCVPRESLKYEAKGLAKLGTLNILYGEKLTLFTPLHPVNIAYQLLVNEMLADEKIPRQIAERLGATNIVPYLKKGKSELYAPIGQTHSPEWIYYSNTDRGSQTISKRFVPYLIKEKLNEFTQHFTQLFQDPRRAVRVNLINMGDCSEALCGIFQYYQDRLLADKNVTVDEISPMIVHIYSKNKQATKFEELSQYTNTEIIENEFNIDLHRNKEYDSEIWLELFHQKVHFYSSEITDNTYEYAHISFFQFDSSKAQMSNYDIDRVPSGLSLGGLMSDMPSVSENNNYRSCFGFKGEKEDLNRLTQIARNINPLLHVAGTDDIYDRKQTTATVINASVRADLDGIYNSSQWVTFIDPKVDLSFFKESKDVVIIHYSDQYNNASGYDAITVTKKCKQYQQALKILLQKYDVTAEENEVNKIIDIFNAINGDWLLKLNSQKSRGSFQDEKISILSAVKVGLALLETPEITWIPISLEEILRVSGGVGLSQKDGLFSAKNLGEAGKTSDDILFIGLEQCNDEIKLHMFPVEVKVGSVNSKTVEDAKKQALHTTKILRENLQGDSFVAKIYRNFFAKIALVNASKLSLYNVWPEYNHRWDKIKDLQQRLLNDSFTLAWSLDNKVGKAGVFSFKASTDYGSRSIVPNSENIYHVELLEPDSAKFLKNSVESVKTDIANLIGTFYPKQGDVTDLASPEATGITSPVAEPDVSTVKSTDVSERDDNQTSETPEEATEPLSVLFGHHANNKTPIQWYPTNTDLVMHTNTGIIGTMGTGKTQFTKSLVAQLSWNSHNNVSGKPLGILIFDYKGDYIKDDFMEATGAKRMDLHHLPYNPLAIISSDNSPPMLPLHTANNICQSIRTAFNLGIKQRQKLRDCIMGAYSLHGIDKSKKQTWSNPAPTISDVCEIYLNDDEVKEDSLYAAISNLHEFEIFEPNSSKTKSLYDLIDGVTVINLSGYDSDIQNLIVAITLDLFYTQMQRNGHSVIDGNYRQLSKFILVDEADNFLSKNFESIKKIMKEGREFGVGTILSTQFLNHFSTGENEYSNYILTWVVHRVSEIKAKEVESLFNITDKDRREELMSGIKSLEKHYSIVNLAGQQPVKMKDKAFWELRI